MRFVTASALQDFPCLYHQVRLRRQLFWRVPVEQGCFRTADGGNLPRAPSSLDCFWHFVGKKALGSRVALELDLLAVWLWCECCLQPKAESKSAIQRHSVVLGWWGWREVSSAQSSPQIEAVFCLSLPGWSWRSGVCPKDPRILQCSTSVGQTPGC